MPARIQGLSEISLNGDTLVKTGAGYVYSLTLAWNGGTIGQAIYLRDALANDPTFLVPINLATANGTIQLRWENGKKFTTGLFVDFQGGGQVQMEMTYK